MLKRTEGYRSGGLLEDSKSNPDQIERKIGDFYGDAELDSTPFKAFADFVDYTAAEKWFRFCGGPEYRRAEMKLCLIEETIRQRTNEVRGYHEEYDRASIFAREYHDALAAKNASVKGFIPADRADRDLPDKLLRIKDKMVRAKNCSS